MNTIEKIIAESKTQKAAAEKIWNLAHKYGYYSLDAALMVKEVKKGSTFSKNLVNDFLAAEKRYNRKQDQEWLENNKPLDTIAKAISDLDEHLTAWFEEAKKDPFYHFSWGDKTFQWAATRKAYLELQRWMKGADDGASLDAQKWEMIIKEITEEVLNMARGGSRSTSACSNLANDCLMAARASIVNGNDWEISAIGYWFSKKTKYDAEEE
jgi:hypothetical protein